MSKPEVYRLYITDRNGRVKPGKLVVTDDVEIYVDSYNSMTPLTGLTATVKPMRVRPWNAKRKKVRA